MTSLTKSPKNGTVKPPTLEKVDTEVPPHDESGALSAEEREVIDVVRCMVSVGFKASDAIGRLALSPKS